MELRPGQGFLDLVLTPENQGVIVIVLAQQVFSIVEASAFEEFRFFEPFAQFEDGAGALVADDAQKVPGLRPECFGFANREAVKIREGLKVGAELRIDLRHELSHARGVRGSLRR